MNIFTLPAVAAVIAAGSLTLAAQTAPAPAKPARATPATKPAMAVAHKTEQAAAEPQSDIVKTYCVGCHNDRGKDRAGSLTLASFDAAHAEQQPEIAEKMIRKLRLGMMPPPGARRPEPAVLRGSPRRSSRRSTRLRPRTRTRDGVRSNGSTAPSISAR